MKRIFSAPSACGLLYLVSGTTVIELNFLRLRRAHRYAPGHVAVDAPCLLLRKVRSKGDRFRFVDRPQHLAQLFTDALDAHAT